jgi:hypothetical protein
MSATSSTCTAAQRVYAFVVWSLDKRKARVITCVSTEDIHWSASSTDAAWNRSTLPPWLAPTVICAASKAIIRIASASMLYRQSPRVVMRWNRASRTSRPIKIPSS